LAVGGVPIRTLHLHKNRFAEYESDIISIEVVVVPANGHNTSWQVIFLIRPEICNGQSTTRAVDRLNAIESVIVERSAGDSHQCICAVDINTRTGRSTTVHITVAARSDVRQVYGTSLAGSDRNPIPLIVG